MLTFIQAPQKGRKRKGKKKKQFKKEGLDACNGLGLGVN